MSIELSLEDLKSAETLVAQGRFSSVEDAVRAGLQVLLAEDEGLRWTPELKAAVDAGVAAVQRADFASDSEMNALFATFQQKPA